MGIKYGYYDPVESEEDKLERLKREEEKFRRQEEINRSLDLLQGTPKPVEYLDAETDAKPIERTYVSKKDLVDEARVKGPEDWNQISDKQLWEKMKRHNPDVEQKMTAPGGLETWQVQLKSFKDMVIYGGSGFAITVLESALKPIISPDFTDTQEEIILQGYKQRNPDLSEEEIKSLWAYDNKEDRKLSEWLKTAAVDRALKGKEVADEYYRKNPDKQAVREWISGNTVSDQIAGTAQYLNQTLAGAAPSMLTVEGVSAVFAGVTALATKGRNPRAILKSYAKGQMAAGFFLGGAGGLVDGVDYLTTDRPIDKQSYDKEISDAKKYFKSRGNVYFDPELRKNVTPDEALKIFMQDEYYQKDGQVWKKGLSKIEAYDAVSLPSLIQGGIEAAIETLSVIPAAKSTTGIDLTKIFGFRHYAKFIENLDKGVRLIPKIPGVKSRLRRNGGQFAVRLLSDTVVEGTEEVLQGMSSELLQNLTWDDRGWDLTFEELREQAIGGAVGGFTMGSRSVLSKTLGLSDRISNMKAKYFGMNGEGHNFFHKVNEAGKHQVHVKVAKLNKETGKTEITTEPVTEEQTWDPDAKESLQTEYDSFDGAQRAVDLLTTWSSDAMNKMHAWKNKRYVEGEAKVEKSAKEKGKYDVNVYNKEGKLLETIETFDTKGKGKARAREFQNNIDITTRFWSRYGGEQIAEDDFIKEYENDRKEGLDVNKEVTEKDEAPETVDKRKRMRLGIQSFLGNQDTSRAEDSIIAEEFTDKGETPVLYDAAAIPNLINEDPEMFNEQLEGLDISPEQFEQEYNDMFQEENPEGYVPDIASLIEQEGPYQSPEEAGPDAEVGPDLDEGPSVPSQVIDEMGPDEGPPAGAPITGAPTLEEKYMELTDVELESLLSDKQKELSTIPKEKMGRIAVKSEIKGIEIEVKRRGAEQTQAKAQETFDKLRTETPKEDKDIKEKRITKEDIKKPTTEEVAVKVKAKKKKEVNERLEMLFNKFVGKVKYEVIDTFEEAAAKHPKITAGTTAWFDPNTKTVYIISEKSDLSEPFHEFAHPFITDIRESNSKLFDSIWEGISSNTALMNQISRDYPELGVDSDEFKEEVIVHALEKMSDERYTASPFMKAVRRVWEWIKEKLFGSGYEFNIYAQTLRPDTSLSDLARILADDSGRYTITLSDPKFTEISEVANDVSSEESHLDVMVDSEPSSLITTDVLTSDTELFNVSNNFIREARIAIKGNKDINVFIKNWGKELNSKYDLNSKFNKKFLAEYKKVGNSEAITNSIIEDIQAKLPTDKVLSDKSIKILEKGLANVEGRIRFRYKFTENVLDKLPQDKKASIENLPNMKGVKGSLEGVYVKDFVKWWNKEVGEKSALPSDIKVRYQDWADNQFSLYANRVTGHESDLHYPELLRPSLRDADIERFYNIKEASALPGVEVYRMLIHDGNVGRFAHMFNFNKIDEVSSINGHGWYTVLKTPEGIILHEYQSDIMPEVKKAVQSSRESLDNQNDLKTGLDKFVDSNKTIALNKAKHESEELINNNEPKFLSISFLRPSTAGLVQKVRINHPKFGQRDYTVPTNSFSLPLLIKSSFHFIQNMGGKEQSIEDMISMIESIDIKDLTQRLNKNDIIAWSDQLAPTQDDIEPPLVRLNTAKLEKEVYNIFHHGSKSAKAEIEAWGKYPAKYTYEEGSKARDIIAFLNSIDNDNILYKLVADMTGGSENYIKAGSPYVRNIASSIAFYLAMSEANREAGTMGVFLALTQDEINNNLISLQNDYNHIIKVKEREEKFKADIQNGNINFEEFIEYSFKKYLHNFNRTYFKNRMAAESIEAAAKDSDFNLDENEIMQEAIEKSGANRYLQYNKNWFPMTIVHSLIHAQHSIGPNQSIYINTGAAIELLEGNPMAAPLYSSKREIQWGLSKKFIKALYARYVSRGDILKEPAFGVDVYDFIGGILTDLDLESFSSLADIESSVYGQSVKRDIQENLITKDMQDKIIDSFIKDGDINHPTYNKNISDMMKGARVGIFYKALGEVESKYDIKFDVVHPEWSSVPLIKADLSNAKKLKPLRFKKVIDESADSKFKPHTDEQVIMNLENKLEYIEEHGAESATFVRNLFSDAWSNVKRIAEEKDEKADVNLFNNVMEKTLPYDLFESYKIWYKNEFKAKKDKRYKPTDNIESGISYLSEESTADEVIALLNDSHDDIQKLGDGKYSDERVTTEGSRMLFKEMNQYVYEKDLKVMMGKAKSKLMDMDSWIDFTVSQIFKRKGIAKKLTFAARNELIKEYNRINSTVSTNREVFDENGKQKSINQKTNLVAKKSKVKGKPKIEVLVKGPVNISTGRQNIRFEKVTLYGYNVNEVNMYWLSGSDVLDKVNIQDEEGRNILGPDNQPSVEWNSAYEFLDSAEMIELNAELKKIGKTVAFSRGDSDKLAIVDVDINEGGLYNANSYWNKQAFITPLQKQNFMKGTDWDRAASIAVDRAIRSVWPKYLLDSKGGSNVLKRLKIPFTPVTISQEMPSYRVNLFDPKEVRFVYGDVSFSPWQTIKGIGPKYIGDGGSITSQAMFDLFTKYHGLIKGTAKGKTVIYNKDGNNVVAIKHQHMLPRANWKITDKAGNTLYTIDKKRNIRDSEGKIVHVLLTKDEAKIWDIGAVDIELPGNSVGFIKYDEAAPQTVKHGIQIYNHVLEGAVFDAFEQHYVPLMSREIKRTYYMALSTGLGTSSERIAKWLSSFSVGEANVGTMPTLIELGKLNAGLHKSMEGLLDSLVQTRRMLPTLNLSKSNGSRYDISMDVTGNLETKEVSLAKQNSNMIYKRYAEFYNIPLEDAKSVTLEEINDWLAENEVNVMVTRYPVPHVGGSFIARVKSLHNRKTIVEMNAFDIFARLEGDGDGDEVQIELLAPEVEAVYKPYFDSIDVKAISLSRFSPNKKPIDLSSTNERLSLIINATTGRRAIAEIANIQTVYGIMSRVYDSINMGSSKIRLKSPDTQITFPQATYDGKLGAWKGDVKDYLRVWLQAAVDNAEFGLLAEWGYVSSPDYFNEPGGQDKLYMKLMTVNGFDMNPKQFRLYASIMRPIIQMHKTAGHIRSGSNFKIGSFKLSDTIWLSDLYYSKIGNNGMLREQGITNLFGKNMPISVSIKNRKLLPVEHIAIMAAKELEEFNSKFDLLGQGATPFMLLDNVHENAHNDTIKYMDSKMISILETRMLKDGIIGNKIKGIKEVRAGKAYARAMKDDFVSILADMNSLGNRTMDVDGKFVEFKDKYHRKFNELSETAKAAATIQFLRGVIQMQDKVQAMKRHANFPVAMPPTSQSASEASVLDSNIMKIFFTQYNSILNDSRKDSSVSSRGTDTSLESIVRGVCG